MRHAIYHITDPLQQLLSSSISGDRSQSRRRPCALGAIQKKESVAGPTIKKNWEALQCVPPFFFCLYLVKSHVNEK